QSFNDSTRSQWLNGRLCLMRYSSVGCTAVVPVKPRRRFGFFVCSKCRLPARGRNTLPLAVIVKRLAADFFVLIPFVRRIIQSSFFKKSAQYTGQESWKQGLFSADLTAEIFLLNRAEP